MRRQIMRERNISAGPQDNPINRARFNTLDTDLLVEMRLQRLAAEAVETDEPASSEAGVFGQYAREERSSTVGGQKDEIVRMEVQRVHQIGIKADAHDRPVDAVARQMVHSGVNVSAMAMGVSVTRASHLNHPSGRISHPPA